MLLGKSRRPSARAWLWLVHSENQYCGEKQRNHLSSSEGVSRGEGSTAGKTLQQSPYPAPDHRRGLQGRPACLIRAALWLGKLTDDMMIHRRCFCKGPTSTGRSRQRADQLEGGEMTTLQTEERLRGQTHEMGPRAFGGLLL